MLDKNSSSKRQKEIKSRKYTRNIMKIENISV